MPKNILICDDEQAIRKLLQYNLQKAGYTVVAVGSGEEALVALKQKKADLAILDIMLPGIDGLELCKQLQIDYGIPVILLSARDTELDTIIGLEIGADDYMTKPFSVRELLARVKAVLRRSERQIDTNNHQKNILTYNRLIIDLAARKVKVDQNEILLTPIEFKLLSVLAEHRDVALSRNEIMDMVWDTDFVGDTRIIDVHVSHLRDKLRINKNEIGYIETVRGIGYRMRC